MTQYAAVKTADIDPGVCGAEGLSKALVIVFDFGRGEA